MGFWVGAEVGPTVGVEVGAEVEEQEGSHVAEEEATVGAPVPATTIPAALNEDPAWRVLKLETAWVVAS